nr:RHS repeat-associated core domain-containing protein [Acanthopleuribacter pedis]
MRYKGRDYEVFGNGASGKLNFPGDVTADIDSKGRLIEVQRPGLALKELTYSDDDQLDQLFFGGQLLRDYDYRNGDLSEIRVVNANGPEDLYAYQYDEHGRLSTILENGAVLAAWTYPDPDNSAGQDPDQRFVDGERVLSYTDGNGVLHRYGYDAYGYTNRIDIEGGPTFHFRRDDAGNLLELQSSGMAVTYTDWREGLPSTMTWGDGTRFSIDRDSNNNLQRIADDAEVFVLDLTWRPESASGDPCESGGTEDKRLTRIERKASTFTEIIEPSYNSDEQLTGVTINRNSNSVTDQIQESYGTVQNQLLGGLTRLLNNQILVDEQLEAEAGADNRRIHQRIGAASATEPSGTDHYSYDPILGNLQQINRRDGTVRTFVWDGFRRLREIRDDNNLTAQYHYDHQYRRIRAATQHHPQPLAFAYEGSKVIAIGLYEGPGQVQWTHAVGQGPLGPAFIKDLTGAGMDYHIFTDHLGTPLAYKNTNTGTIYINPRSPWGESLANTPTRGSPYTTQNFTLPPDPIFPTTPLGLSGHLEDADTGLTYMHHRYYSPELGHFLNPDFRAPDIYDPTTFTEPYSYATGNPMMFWDPNGLETALIQRKDNTSLSVDFKPSDFGLDSLKDATHEELETLSGDIVNLLFEEYRNENDSYVINNFSPAIRDLVFSRLLTEDFRDLKELGISVDLSEVEMINTLATANLKDEKLMGLIPLWYKEYNPTFNASVNEYLYSLIAAKEQDEYSEIIFDTVRRGTNEYTVFNRNFENAATSVVGKVSKVSFEQFGIDKIGYFMTFFVTAKGMKFPMEEVFKNVALGHYRHEKYRRKADLEAFANQMNASVSKNWSQRGFHRLAENKWPVAFSAAMNTAINRGGKILFDLTEVNIRHALNPKNANKSWLDGYTEWELRQILGNKNWLKNTIFYMNGKRLNKRDLKKLGIL